MTKLRPADVRTAARRIAAHVRRTPLLSALSGVRLKAEHRQRSGSFKLRGAVNAVLGLGAKHVVTGSSGNHGIALATLAAPLGIRVTVVLAAGASPTKVAQIHALGAHTIAVTGGVVEREARAHALAQETGALFIPSSNHKLVVAGQGTVGAEILADAPGTDTIYVPTGGGGLLAGVCLAAHDHAVRVVGVEPATTPRYARSLASGRPIRLPPSDTVADGLRGQQPGAVPYSIIRDRVDDLIAVTDAEILAAAALLRRHGIEAEPSGAVALAGALQAGPRRRAVAIVSGGNTTAAVTAATTRTPGGKVMPITTVDTAELLITIYRDILGDAGLDAHSDFYEAGGDSLSAIQVTARLQAALGIEVPVALVFAYPSPADLAEVVDSDFVRA